MIWTSRPRISCAEQIEFSCGELRQRIFPIQHRFQLGSQLVDFGVSLEKLDVGNCASDEQIHEGDRHADAEDDEEDDADEFVVGSAKTNRGIVQIAEIQLA